MRPPKNIVIIILLLLILTGGVFITSGSFKESLNSPKEYFVLISMILLILVCVISRSGLQKMVESLNSSIFLNGVMIVCLLTTIYGLLQYYGLISSNHSAFPITGTFENPAGFIAVQSAMFPIVLTRWFDEGSGSFIHLLSIIVSLLCITSVILSGSRTGFLAMCSVIVIVLTFNDTVYYCIKTHPWIWLPIVTIAISLLVLLYYIKQDSADGRVFIWNRCFDMIKKRPLLGYGVDGFHHFYMSEQAEYFQKHPDSQYVMLADNVGHPFNEYIKLTVNYGLSGLSVAIILLVWIVRKLFNCNKKIKILGLSFVTSVFTMCQFSYPFQYVAVWLLSFITIIPAFIDQKKEIIISKRGAAITSSLLLILLSLTLRKMYFEMKWTEISKRSRIGLTESMLKYYDDMPLIMKHNPLFLYNYAAELCISGHYKESLLQNLKCAEKRNDYQVQLLFANIYTGLQEKEKAIQSLDKACNMIPCRFEPLYGKMLLFKNYNDTINAIRIAHEIIEKPKKIHSERVAFIVEHAKQILSDYD